MFTDEIELSDFEKMDNEYQELLGRVLTIQADCEIGGPHLYLHDILPSAPTKIDRLIVARTAAEEMDHFRKIAYLAHHSFDLSFDDFHTALGVRRQIFRAEELSISQHRVQRRPNVMSNRSGYATNGGETLELVRSPPVNARAPGFAELMLPVPALPSPPLPCVRRFQLAKLHRHS